MKSERVQDEVLQQMIFKISDAVVYLDSDFCMQWWNQPAGHLLELRPYHQQRRLVEILSYPEVNNFLKYPRGSLHLQLENHTTITLTLIPDSNSGCFLIVKNVSENHFTDKVRQDFVANVSHELRTPLTVMHGYLETLSEIDTEHQFHIIFQQMQQQTLRMKALVNDLLLLSRLEGQEIDKSSLTVIDIPRLLKEVRSAGLSLSNKRHAIDLNITSEASIMGDVSELRSAFSNLLFNAIRYTPEGGHVTLRWFEQDKYLCFSVKDTGIGIPHQHISRITERFYRVDQGRSRDAGGTGLGLAIVKHVLLRHNASLEINSKEKEGSEFICSFHA